MKPVMSFGMILMLCASVSLAESSRFNINGTWVGKAPDGSIIKYTFTKDSTVLWSINEKGFSSIFPKGLRGKYKISLKNPISLIDISEFKHPMFKNITFRGIFQVIDSTSIKFQGLPSSAGPRLKKFSKQAIVYKRVKK